MEAYTSGVVSYHARTAYRDARPSSSATFESLGRGRYRMVGWESQIQMARAMGRGRARGRNETEHPADTR